jgi:hypothetical protein
MVRPHDSEQQSAGKESTMANMAQTVKDVLTREGSHAEGPVARAIESRTAQLPSDVFLWAAGASILGSLALRVFRNRDASQFVGQWAPTLLILGLYNKIVKVAGHERVTA